MPTDIEYALMAANVYGDSTSVLSPTNTLPAPVGWGAVTPPAGWATGAQEGSVVSYSSGFMASAYKKGSEIVISYAGTTTGPLDWIFGNVPAATGAFFTTQVFEAAKFYLDIKNQPENAGATISFTGHSLGGGLASLMAVLFDKQAVVFDEAPFLKSADSRIAVNLLRTTLLLAGYEVPPALATYVTSLDNSGAVLPSPSRLAREDNVRNIYVIGEALSLASTTLTDAIAALLGLTTGSLTLAIAGFGVDKIGSQPPTELDTGALLTAGAMKVAVTELGLLSATAGPAICVHR
jgi:hypothetical protein